ncbi:MAG: glycoside hydrolase family 88 protein, partial [Bacteroidota bacterium]|nr:glycoside hydrolase family 88 protein [Bacteroidota bacterium]
MTRSSFFLCCLVSVATVADAQKGNDVTAPLHAMKPDYAVPYAVPDARQVKDILDRIYNYLDAVTPVQLINRVSNEVITGTSSIDTNTVIRPGDFRLTSYEWGVTYSGMLAVGETTGDKRFTDYTKNRMEFIAASVPSFKTLYAKYPKASNPFRQPVAPHALDDVGAVCAAMIKTLRSDGNTNLRPLVDHYMTYISTKEYRLADGTLARNRPQKNTLWLDDLYMSVPALAQMGKLTGDKKYFDDAVKQVSQFSNRMFNKNLNVYMHGWVEEMAVHPE